MTPERFEELYRRADRIAAHFGGRNHDARADYAQEAMIKVSRVLAAQPDVSDAYLRKTMLRKMVDIWRSDHQQHLPLEDHAGAKTCFAAKLHDRLDHEYALSCIDAHDRELLLQFADESTTPESLAEDLGLTISALKSRVHRIRKCAERYLDQSAAICGTAQHGAFN